MICLKCGCEDTKVLESRMSHEGKSVRRRRSCTQCNHRFTTYEKEEELQLQILKKDGRFEPYNREKILRSVQIACQKRPITINKIDALVETVERRLQEDGERTIGSQKVGDHIMEILRQTDHVAYVRFASVYKDFKDPEEFLAELQALKQDSSELGGSGSGVFASSSARH